MLNWFPFWMVKMRKYVLIRIWFMLNVIVSIHFQQNRKCIEFIFTFHRKKFLSPKLIVFLMYLWIIMTRKLICECNEGNVTYSLMTYQFRMKMNWKGFEFFFFYLRIKLKILHEVEWLQEFIVMGYNATF